MFIFFSILDDSNKDMNLENGINEEYEDDFDEESMHSVTVKGTDIQDERSAVIGQGQEIKFDGEDKIQEDEKDGGNWFTEDEGEVCEESVKEICEETVKDPIPMSDFRKELKLEKQGKILVFLIVPRKKIRQV